MTMPAPPITSSRRSRASRWLRGIAIASAAMLLIAVALDRLFPLQLPVPDSGSTVVLARDGTPLRAFADSDGVWRYPTTASEVSPLYLSALLHYEDRWFYQHPGVNPYALLRGLAGGILHGRIVSGGSTLTMQVARIIHPIPHTFRGKLVQIFRALQLEAHLSKKQILDLYLNHAPFGGPIEGVEAASWAYLGKPASRLSRAEAALLAVLPQSPSRLRPDRHPAAARAARDKVLRRMRDLGVWSAAQIKDAEIEPVVARSLRAPLSAALLAERLHRQYPRQRRITSTIDANLQRAAEDRVSAYLSRLPAHSTAALMVVDNATLETRVYLGTSDFADPQRHGYIDMVTAPRSPGSTLKPFLYGLALDDGLIDSQSLLVGAKPNLSIILGGAATRLETLVGAYTAFANAGIAGTPRYTSQQSAHPRRLLSPGAAWIIRDILGSNPADVEGAPLAGVINRHANVAWKTGTSYGYRDAWSIGVTDRWTIGAWIGRPDGTPSPGQYGAVTALPLLFQIADMLRQRGGRTHLAQPDSVRAVDVCWPRGGAAASTPAPLCRQRRTAWVLDEAIPPTFAERDLGAWSSGLLTLRVNQHGQRLSGACHAQPEHTIRIARWPVLAMPWLSADDRRAATLPPLAPGCAADSLDVASPIRIAGLNSGVTLRRAPNSDQPLRVTLNALGTQGPVQWLLNGRLQGSSEGDASMRITLPQRGDYRITALARDGAFATLTLQVLGRPDLPPGR